MTVLASAPILLPDLAGLIRDQATEQRPLLVCVDGLTGAGKTTLAEALRSHLQTTGTPAFRISVDDFHNPRSVRHSLGRLSAQGYYLHSHDYEKLRRFVIDPARGSGAYCSIVPRAFDLTADREVYAQPLSIKAPAVIVVEGSFMLRESLRAVWDFTIFVSASRAVAVSRVARRDQSLFVSQDAAAIISERYHGAHDIHDRLNRPREIADLCIDNTDPSRPVITCRGGFRHRRREPLPGCLLVLGVSQAGDRCDSVGRVALDAESVRIALWDDGASAARCTPCFADAAVEIDRRLATTGHFLDAGFQCGCDRLCEHIVDSISSYFGRPRSELRIAGERL